MAIAWWLLLGFFVVLAGPGVATAQITPPPTYAGDLWARPRLSGDWGGFRDELAKKGVVFDADMLLMPQGVLTGGRDTDAAFWGNAEYTLNLDTGKAGLWPGGFLKVMGLTGFGDTVDTQSGSLLPANTTWLFPKPNTNTSALTNATFTQFLSKEFGLTAGKIFVLDNFHREFTGNWRTQFENVALAFPAAGALVAFSAYGGGIIALPSKDIELSLLAIDPSGTMTNSDITEAFRDGVMVVGSGKVTIKPFGLLGSQNLGFYWSNKERIELRQDPANTARLLLRERFPLLGDPGPVLLRILQRFFPAALTPVQPLATSNNTWTVFYGFDQYLWQPAGHPHRGIGAFFTFGVSDGVVNPIKYSYNLGIGGNGVVPGRPDDNFGIGWARTEVSNNFLPLLRQLGLGLDREDAIEMYYNAAVTSWLGATADLQIVDPAIKKTLSSSGSSGRLRNIDTAVIAGLRLYIRF